MTEFCHGGTLFEVLHEKKKTIKNISFKQRWKMALDIAKGMHFMHSLKPPLMHRDLKSANVFLNSDDTVKLGDMNVSKVATKEGLNFTQTGTPYYASPEVWRDEPYDIKSDIWSLGCVLYEMITLKPPF